MCTKRTAKPFLIQILVGKVLRVVIVIFILTAWVFIWEPGKWCPAWPAAHHLRGQLDTFLFINASICILCLLVHKAPVSCYILLQLAHYHIAAVPAKVALAGAHRIKW